MTISELLSIGKYWEALGLEPDSAPPTIIAKVLDLQDQYSDLRLPLGRAQTILTQHLKAYGIACSERDRFQKRITKLYGPEVFHVEQHMLANLWTDLENTLLEESAIVSAVKKTCRRASGQSLAEIRSRVERLPTIEFTAHEIAHKEASRSQVRKDCDRCKGSGVVTEKESLATYIGLGLLPSWFGNSPDLVHMGLDRLFLVLLKHLPRERIAKLSSCLRLDESRWPLELPSYDRAMRHSIDWPAFLAELGGLVREYPELGAKLHEVWPERTITKPCPQCHREVRFVLSPDLKRGWLVRDASGSLWVRVSTVRGLTFFLRLQRWCLPVKGFLSSVITFLSALWAIRAVQCAVVAAAVTFAFWLIVAFWRVLLVLCLLVGACKAYNWFAEVTRPPWERGRR